MYTIRLDQEQACHLMFALGHYMGSIVKPGAPKPLFSEKQAIELTNTIGSQLKKRDDLERDDIDPVTATACWMDFNEYENFKRNQSAGFGYKAIVHNTEQPVHTVKFLEVTRGRG